ncbi:hypothetical protein CW752_07640 [Chryseobacterium sp. PMSZPI]|nr:hypothetical protein CW752_07640 [Chryseobacterium sp. PMSZPI]
MKVYFENEGKIKKINGTIYWDYATTVGTYNESFLMVPVVDNGKVISVLQVPRKKDTIYFYFTDFSNHIAFFQTLLFSKYEKRAYTNDRANPATRDVICTTSWYSVWMPDNEQLPYPETGPGHWETYSVIKCEQRDQEPDTCIGVVGPNGECPGGGGTPPGGGGGYPYPEDPKPIQETRTPCGKTKRLLESPKTKAITEDLKNHMNSGKKGEKGWRDNKTGDPTQAGNNGDHSVNFGDPSTMNGGYHNHTGTKIDIFSATDIATLIEIARYQSIGNIGNAYVGLMAPNGIHYVIFFKGNHGNLPANVFDPDKIDIWNFSQFVLQRDLLKDPSFYSIINGQKVLNNKGLEQVFFNTLEKMGLQNKIALQKIENNNTVLTVNQNSDGTITPVPCN